MSDRIRVVSPIPLILLLTAVLPTPAIAADLDKQHAEIAGMTVKAQEYRALDAKERTLRILDALSVDDKVGRFSPSQDLEDELLKLIDDPAVSLPLRLDFFWCGFADKASYSANAIYLRLALLDGNSARIDRAFDQLIRHDAPWYSWSYAGKPALLAKAAEHYLEGTPDLDRLKLIAEVLRENDFVTIKVPAKLAANGTTVGQDLYLDGCSYAGLIYSLLGDTKRYEEYMTQATRASLETYTKNGSVPDVVDHFLYYASILEAQGDGTAAQEVRSFHGSIKAASDKVRSDLLKEYQEELERELNYEKEVEDLRSVYPAIAGKMDAIQENYDRNQGAGNTAVDQQYFQLDAMYQLNKLIMNLLLRLRLNQESDKRA